MQKLSCGFNCTCFRWVRLRQGCVSLPNRLKHRNESQSMNKSDVDDHGSPSPMKPSQPVCQVVNPFPFSLSLIATRSMINSCYPYTDVTDEVLDQVWFAWRL